MKKWMAFVTIFFISLAASAQYGNKIDRYFYEDNFDWRWDVRVRISDGHRSGYLTNNEARRLYRILEQIERKEWAFQSDGYYSVWEQDEIWMDVVDLNHRIGLELSDWDRRYYGYSGVVIHGRLPFYFGKTYSFNRFDNRGYGSISLGYAPRNYYPVTHVYYTNNNSYKNHWKGYDNKRVAVPRRNDYSSNNNSSARRIEERRVESSRENYQSNRNSRIETRDSNGNVRENMRNSSGNSDINRGSSRSSNSIENTRNTPNMSRGNDNNSRLSPSSRGANVEPSGRNSRSSENSSERSSGGSSRGRG